MSGGKANFNSYGSGRIAVSPTHHIAVKMPFQTSLVHLVLSWRVRGAESSEKREMQQRCPRMISSFGKTANSRFAWLVFAGDL